MSFVAGEQAKLEIRTRIVEPQRRLNSEPQQVFCAKIRIVV